MGILPARKIGSCFIWVDFVGQSGGSCGLVGPTSPGLLLRRRRLLGAGELEGVDLRLALPVVSLVLFQAPLQGIHIAGRELPLSSLYPLLPSGIHPGSRGKTKEETQRHFVEQITDVSIKSL